MNTLMKNGAVASDQLRQCFKILSDALDQLDIDPEHSATPAKQLCEMLFERIVEAGIWDDEEPAHSDDLFAATAY